MKIINTSGGRKVHLGAKPMFHLTYHERQLLFQKSITAAHFRSWKTVFGSRVSITGRGHEEYAAKLVEKREERDKKLEQTNYELKQLYRPVLHYTNGQYRCFNVGHRFCDRNGTRIVAYGDSPLDAYRRWYDAMVSSGRPLNEYGLSPHTEK